MNILIFYSIGLFLKIQIFLMLIIIIIITKVNKFIHQILIFLELSSFKLPD